MDYTGRVAAPACESAGARPGLRVGSGAAWSDKIDAVPKVREAIKLIEADGWREVTTKGSHRQFKHPTKVGRVTIAGQPSRSDH